LLEEFSHTVLHGENFAKKLQAGGQNQPSRVSAASPSIAIQQQPSRQILTPSPRPIVPPVIVKSPQIGAIQPPMAAKFAYDPAKIYNAPLVRRSNPTVQKSIENKKKLAAAMQIDSLKKKPAAPVARTPSAERENVESVQSDRRTPLSFLEQQQKKKQEEIAKLNFRQRNLLEKQRVITRHNELHFRFNLYIYYIYINIYCVYLARAFKKRKRKRLAKYSIE
jgi:hypothetical protein